MLDELVLHAVVVLVELARLVDEVRDVRRREEDHVLRLGVPVTAFSSCNGILPPRGPPMRHGYSIVKRS